MTKDLQSVKRSKIFSSGISFPIIPMVFNSLVGKVNKKEKDIGG